MPIQAVPVPQTPVSRKLEYEICQNQTDTGRLNQSLCDSEVFLKLLEGYSKPQISIETGETEGENISNELRVRNRVNYWEKIRELLDNSDYSMLLNNLNTRNELETIISKLSELNLRDLNMDISGESIFFNFFVGDYSIYYDYYFESEFEEENEIVSVIYQNKKCLASIKGDILEANDKLATFLNG